MIPPFSCELDYFPSAHLSQLYVGFEKLRKMGIVDLSIRRSSGRTDIPLLNVRVNGKINVVYDTLDGLNWIKGSIEENLKHFNETTTADFYFKRSLNQQILENAPKDCRVLPLGFNYRIKVNGNYPVGLMQKTKELIKGSEFLERSLGLNKVLFDAEDYEYYSLPSKKPKIMFLAGLWNTQDVSSLHLREEREEINNTRVKCIRACKTEFGVLFTGGVQSDNFSKRYAPDLLLPLSTTRKQNFLNNVKEHDICIATTGLHNSTGWKFGE